MVMLYKPNGKHAIDGRMVDYIVVETESDIDQAHKDGWMTHAQVWADELPEDSAPVTRAELEAKADELGIKYNGRTSDKRLMTAIQDALA